MNTNLTCCKLTINVSRSWLVHSVRVHQQIDGGQRFWHPESPQQKDIQAPPQEIDTVGHECADIQARSRTLTQSAMKMPISRSTPRRTQQSATKIPELKPFSSTRTRILASRDPPNRRTCSAKILTSRAKRMLLEERDTSLGPWELHAHFQNR